jgi:hypothetical protein
VLYELFLQRSGTISYQNGQQLAPREEVIILSQLNVLGTLLEAKLIARDKAALLLELFLGLQEQPHKVLSGD